MTTERKRAALETQLDDLEDQRADIYREIDRLEQSLSDIDDDIWDIEKELELLYEADDEGEEDDERGILWHQR